VKRQKSLSIAISTLLSLLLVGCPDDGGDSTTSPGASAPGGEQHSGSAPDGPSEPAIDSDDGEPRIFKLFKRKIYRDGEVWVVEKTTKSGEVVHWEFPRRHVHGFIAGLLQLWVTNSNEPQPGQGGLGGILRRLFGDFTASQVLVDVEQIQVKVESGSWETVSYFGSDPRTIDLLRLHISGFSQLGAFQLPIGQYHGVRLLLANNHRIEVDEGNGLVWRTLRMWAGQQRQIDIIGDFSITEHGFTSMYLDFSADESIFKLLWNYYLRPEITLLSVTTDQTLQAEIDPSTGGELAIQDQVRLVLPADSIEHVGQVALQPLSKLGIHSQLLSKIGQEHLLTIDVEIVQALQLSMYFHPDYLTLYDESGVSLDIYRFDEGSNTWAGLGAVFDAESRTLTTDVWQLGLFVVGIRQLDINAEACRFYGLNGLSVLAESGLDFNFFAPSCHQARLCGQHGSITYGKSVEACLADFGPAMLSQCQSICNPFSGDNCDELPETWQNEPWAKLPASLLGVCQDMAELVYDIAEAAPSELSGSEQSCLDYDELGVSCQAPTCQLIANPSTVPLGEVVELGFNLNVSGSFTKVAFEQETIFEVPPPALAGQQSFQIVESDRVLIDHQVFTAQVWGPGAVQPISCSATVSVVDLRPCSIAIVPLEIEGGETAELLMTVQSGWSGAEMDMRVEGVFSPVGLSEPNAQGIRYFHSDIRPTATRNFNGRVYNHAGTMHTCSQLVEVN